MKPWVPKSFYAMSSRGLQYLTQDAGVVLATQNLVPSHNDCKASNVLAPLIHCKRFGLHATTKHWHPLLLSNNHPLHLNPLLTGNRQPPHSRLFLRSKHHHPHLPALLLSNHHPPRLHVTARYFTSVSVAGEQPPPNKPHLSSLLNHLLLVYSYNQHPPPQFSPLLLNNHQMPSIAPLLLDHHQPSPVLRTVRLHE